MQGNFPITSMMPTVVIRFCIVHLSTVFNKDRNAELGLIVAIKNAVVK